MPELIGLLLIELMQLVFVLYTRLAFISNVAGVVVDHSWSYYAFVTTSPFTNNKLGPKVRSNP